jgi:hypothetical protein
MPQTIANLPSAVSNIIQQGILALDMQEALQPALLWRNLFEKRRHPGRIGESVTMTREGLITPDDQTTALRTPGQDPGTLTRSVEQFLYQVKPYGKGLDVHLPSDYVSSSSEFRNATRVLGIHAAMTLGRIARNALFAAYAGGNTFATTGATSTALVVQDATGFDTVVVNGTPVAVSAANPGSLTIAGVTKAYTAVVLATNTITLSVSSTWSQYDVVLRSDAPGVIRQNGRTSPRTLIAGDTPTFATFRNAATQLRNMNVPGMDGQMGGLYGCYIDADVENVLFADAELVAAKNAIGITQNFAEGTIGVYGGIRFMRMPKSESIIIPSSSTIQTPFHRSIMFGQYPGIEVYVPETEFQGVVAAGGVPEAFATSNHYKMPLDPEAVLTLVLRAPIDKAGEIMSASWLANCDYCMPTDTLAITGNQRVKRACVIETAGPL